MIGSSTCRRRLHARRAGAAQQGAQHDTVREFKWASDRIQEGTVPFGGVQYRSETATHSAAFAAHQCQPGSTAAAACQNAHVSQDVAQADGFRWISEYIDLGNEQDTGSGRHSCQQQQRRQQQQQRKCTTEQRIQQADQAKQQHNLQAKHPTVQLAATAAAGASMATTAAAKAVATAGTAAASVAASAGSWFVQASGKWLDHMLGYDSHLAGIPDALAAAGSATAAGAARAGANAGPATAGTLSWAAWQVRRQHPAEQPIASTHRRHTAPSLQQQQQPPVPQHATGSGAGTQRTTGHDQQPAAAAPEQLGYMLAPFVGVAALAHEVSDAMLATYTDTLKPGALVLWQLVMAVSGLVGVILMCLLLPAVKMAAAGAQRVLLAAGKLLHGCTGQLRHCLAPRQAAPPVAGIAGELASSTTAAAAATGGLITAESTSTAAGAHSITCMMTNATQQQEALLAAARQHLTAALSANPSHLLDFTTLYSATGSFSSTAVLPECAGYGPCAYKASLAAASVAVQLQLLRDEQQVKVWCSSVQLLCGLRHPQLLHCIGAAVGLLPMTSCGTVGSADIAAATAGPSSSRASMGRATAVAQSAVVGCLVFELLQQPVTLQAALQAVSSNGVHSSNSASGVVSPAAHIASSADNAASSSLNSYSPAVQHNIRSRPSSATTPCLHVGRSPIAGSSSSSGSIVHGVGRRSGAVMSPVAAAAAATINSSDALGEGLHSWCDRIQLAPQLVSGLQYLVVQLAAAEAQDTAACQLAAGAGMASGSGWLSQLESITAVQLASAVVVDATKTPLQTKFHPAALLQLTRRLERLQSVQAAGVGAGSVPTAATANFSGTELLPALGDLMLMLLCGTADACIRVQHISCSSTADSRAKLLQRLSQQEDGVAGLLPVDEQGCLDAAGLQILRKYLQHAVHLMTARQQQTQQQQQQGRATFSAAAAEALEMEDAAESEQQQHELQQHELQAQRQQQQVGAYSTAGQSGSRFWPRWLRPSTRQMAHSRGTDDVLLPCNGTANNASHNAATASGDTAPAAALAAGLSHFNWSQFHAGLHQVASDAVTWQQQHRQQHRPLSGQHIRPSSPTEPPSYFICPITASVMSDPVVAPDGYTYERSALAEWLRVARVCRSPMTNQPMEPVMVPNHSLRSSIMEWRLQLQQQEWKQTQQ